jgi:prepilin-type N-terminal cleavage/methylation domain-containing protein
MVSDISKPKNDEKGFTLMELLVVIAVIGLLSSIIFAITRGADEQGRIARGLYFSQHLHNSLGSYIAGAWNFDEGSGSTANDTSGWGNNGSLVNSPVWRCASTDTSYTPSAQGCSLEFNGTNNYVDLGSTASLDNAFENKQQFTIELWVNSQVITPRPEVILSKWVVSPMNGWVLRINDTRLPYFHIREDADVMYANAPASIIANKWHHIAIVRDTQNITVYLDSKAGTPVTTSLNIFAADANLLIGYAVLNNYFSGLIDEVRIYSTALTAAQIRDQYYAGLERLLTKGKITKQEYQEILAKN